MRVGKFFARLMLIFFWILVISVALYFPSWKIFPFEEKSLNIFTWGDLIDFSILSEFEKETGIKVNLSFFSSNEELQVKMRATGGNGYDLIMPSGYTVNTLAQEDLLKPFDRRKLKFWNDLNPVLLNHWFDPNNRYSIPFSWEVYGLGIDRSFFADRPKPSSWKAIYDPSQIDYKIAVSNDPIEAVAFSSLYLFGQANPLSFDQFEQVRQLLFKQRRWVEAYSDFRADYFIVTGNCPVVVTTTTYVKRIQPIFPQIGFVIPKEGTFLTIENFCISRSSTKEKYIYQLLDYLYTKQSMLTHHQKFWFFPATLSPIDELELNDYEKTLFELSSEEFSKFYFIKNLAPQQQVRDLWVQVKSF